MEAVARQTSPGGIPATFVARLSDRIHALATVQDLLVGNDWRGIEVSALAKGQLAHFKDLIGTRVTFSGPALNLTPAAVQGIGCTHGVPAPNAKKPADWRALRKSLKFVRKFGAGEGIRTLDPDLGKVVLYP